MALCTDKYVQECYDKKIDKRLNCNRLRDRKNCPFSCGRCSKYHITNYYKKKKLSYKDLLSILPLLLGPPAAPLTKCLQRKPIHGCCWNGKNPLKSDKSDCPRKHSL